MTPCIRPQAVSGCLDDDDNLAMDDMGANRGKEARLADSVWGAMLTLLLTAESDVSVGPVFPAVLHKTVASSEHALLVSYRCAVDDPGRPVLDGRSAASSRWPFLPSPMPPLLM